MAADIIRIKTQADKDRDIAQSLTGSFTREQKAAIVGHIATALMNEVEGVIDGKIKEVDAPFYQLVKLEFRKAGFLKEGNGCYVCDRSIQGAFNSKTHDICNNCAEKMLSINEAMDKMDSLADLVDFVKPKGGGNNGNGIS